MMTCSGMGAEQERQGDVPLEDFQTDYLPTLLKSLRLSD